MQVPTPVLKLARRKTSATTWVDNNATPRANLIRAQPKFWEVRAALGWESGVAVGRRATGAVTAAL